MVLRKCQAYIIYSVVTVHGIRDDYKIAWTKEDGTWWVVSELFEDFSTREVDYSYEIGEEATIFQEDGIKLHAERLLTAYAKDRASLEEVGSDIRNSKRMTDIWDSRLR